MDTSLPHLQAIERADRKAFEAARARYLDDPTDKHRLALVEPAERWAASQKVLAEAVDAVRRAGAAEAMA